MSEERREKFLDRWSRLKGAPRAAASPADAKQPAADADLTPAPAGTEAADAAPPLPLIDDLTPDSDIAAYFRKGVPEELRRLAMRRMWSLDPAIRDFVEMAENQYDFNAVDGVPGFGELAPGTSISELLAQATGSGIPRPDPTAPQAGEIAAAHIDHELDSTLGQGEPKSIDPVRRSDVGATPPMPGVVDELSAELAEPALGDESAPRRRHGGALPV